MFEFSQDRRLLADCIEGSKQSWDEFVERFSKLIYWSIRKTLKDSSFARQEEELCQEIFQEIFQRLLEKNELTRLRQTESVGKFLSVMACHQTLDKIRHLNRQAQRTAVEPNPLAQLEGKFQDPLRSAQDKERQGVVEGVLAKLSPIERASIEFHYLDGMSHKEIGGILGIPANTISSLIRRTRQRLEGQFARQRAKDF